MVFRLFVVFLIIFVLMFVAFDDNVPFALFKKARCKLGWHKIHNKIGRLKVRKYYCKFCKKPREHPILKVVDGGNKMRDDKFKF